MNEFLVVARAVHLGSTATFAGLFLFLFFVGEPAFRSCGGAPIGLRKCFLTIGWISLVTAIPSGTAWFLLLAFDLAGRSWDVLRSEAIPWRLLTETRFGNDTLVRLGLAALLSICLLRFHPNRGWGSRWDGLSALVLVACLAGTLAWAGHGSAGSGALGGLQLAADALHSLAATAWVGGLAPLLALLIFARRTNDEPSPVLAASATWRFSQYGLVSVAALLGTGIVNTVFLVGSVPGLVGTDYGRLLLIKIALFALMVSFAAVNRFQHLPQLFGPHTPATSALGRIQRNGGIELGLGVVVLIIVGALGTMPPAAHTQAWWPFPLRLNPEVLQEPRGWLGLAGTLSGIIVAALAIAAAVRSKRWRWMTVAVAAVLLVWALPRLSLITLGAFPTSFFVSPTGYSAHSIAAGRALFAEHCVSCHGPDGRGDGPAAKDLQPPPADLTAEHIYGHSDGDLFWWVTNGIGEAMPPLGAVIDETARWNLIDFIRANADARRLQTADEGTPSLRVPEFSVECPDGSDVSISQLRGRVLHLIFAGPQSNARLDQLRAMEPRVESIAVQLDGPETLPLCRTRDHEVIAAFAIYRGAEPIETEFLIDASGWLRSMWYPGVKPDWREPKVFDDEIETIVKTPGQPQPVGVHVHVH